MVLGDPATFQMHWDWEKRLHRKLVALFPREFEPEVVDGLNDWMSVPKYRAERARLLALPEWTCPCGCLG